MENSINQVVTPETKGSGFKKVAGFLPAILVLAIITGGAFLGANLVQKPSYRDGFAACYSCGGITCPDGTSFGSDSCSYQSCDARKAEACSGHGGGGGGGSSSGGGGNNDGYSQSACTSACKNIKGEVNGGKVSGRKNSGKNEGGVKSCECYCSSGGWNSSYSACEGNKTSDDKCTNGTTAVRDGCNYTCTSGAWLETTCEGGNSTGGQTGACGANGDVSCDSSCGEGRGKVCQIDGTWSGCVNADKCGFQGTKQPGQACNFSSACSSLCCVKIDSNGNPTNQLASGQAGICGDKNSYSACGYGGNPSGQCSFDGRSFSVPSTGSGNFVGCGNEVPGGDGDECNNCYVQSSSQVGGACNISCFRETLSCGLRCKDNNQSGGGTQPTNPPPTGGGNTDTGSGTIFTNFYCANLSSSNATPKIGETVSFTCSAGGSGLSSVSKYEFQYRVGGGQFRNIPASSNQINVSEGLTISEVGQYHIQCRACDNTECTEWDTL